MVIQKCSTFRKKVKTNPGTSRGFEVNMLNQNNLASYIVVTATAEYFLYLPVK